MEVRTQEKGGPREQKPPHGGAVPGAEQASVRNGAVGLWGRGGLCTAVLLQTEEGP